MEGVTLVRVRLQGGCYVGLLTADRALAIQAVHDGVIVAHGITEADEHRKGAFRVQVDLPHTVIGAGVQVISLQVAEGGAVLDRITLMAGAALDEDIRAEVALLRDELEMLKRAFRRESTHSSS